MQIFNSRYYSQYTSTNVIRRLLRGRLTPRAAALFQCVRRLPAHGRVLDVGTGVGGLLDLFEQERPDLRTFGIDLGTPPHYLASGPFVRGNILNLPFPDATFDLISCSHVIEHLHDAYAAVAELRRVCKPGGFVYLETPSPRAALMPFGFSFWDDPTHVRPYSRVALARLLAGAGIETVKTGTKRSIPGLLFGLPYMLIGRFMKDEQARAMFPLYAFGLHVYALGRKPLVSRLPAVDA